MGRTPRFGSPAGPFESTGPATGSTGPLRPWSAFPIPPPPRPGNPENLPESIAYAPGRSWDYRPAWFWCEVAAEYAQAQVDANPNITWQTLDPMFRAVFQTVADAAAQMDESHAEHMVAIQYSTSAVMAVVRMTCECGFDTTLPITGPIA